MYLVLDRFYNKYNYNSVNIYWLHTGKKIISVPRKQKLLLPLNETFVHENLAIVKLIIYELTVIKLLLWRKQWNRKNRISNTRLTLVRDLKSYYGSLKAKLWTKYNCNPKICFIQKKIWSKDRVKITSHNMSPP